MLTGLRTSLIRTVSPMIVGFLLGLPISPAIADLLGVTTDQAALYVGSAVTGVLSFAWYVAVRVLERKFPQFSVLLGSVAQPTYLTPGDDPGKIGGN